jgi:hypothetical protein
MVISKNGIVSTSKGFLSYISNFMGATEPIRSNWRPNLKILAVAGERRKFLPLSEKHCLN